VKGSEVVRSFADWVALGEYKKAAEAIDALPDEERGAPRLRYARARVASLLEDHTKTRDLLAELEKELPEFGDSIAELRANAQLEVGPFDEAAKYFSKQTDAEAQVRVARAYQRAGELGKAWSVAEQAVRQAARQDRVRKRRTGRAETEARVLRAELALARERKHEAVNDWYWVITEDPTHPAARDAEAELEKLGRTLTRAEELRRLEAFGDAGLVERARRLEAGLKASKIPLSKVDQGRIARALAWALYNARQNYSEAAAFFASAASVDAKHRVEDSFYAARALSRANQDEAAQKAYIALEKQFPTSSFAEKAAYLGARIDYIGGDFKKAIAGYSGYLARYGKRGRARFQGAVEYELAVSELASGAGASAAKRFGNLAKREREARERARLIELEGAALAQAGEAEEARERFEQVLQIFPLSFPAALARLRLEELNAEASRAVDGGALSAGGAPSDLETRDTAERGGATSGSDDDADSSWPQKLPQPSPPPEDLELPERAEILLSLGFPDDAEAALFLSREALMKKHHPRGGEALCELGARTGAARERYAFGRRLVKGDALYRAPEEDNLWAWHCLYPRPYPMVLDAVSHKTGVGSSLFYAIMRQESAFKPEVGSSAGARGLMQLIPPTAERVAEELAIPHRPDWLERPAYNIRLGSTYVARLLNIFEGVVPIAVASYNAGPQAVTRWLASGDTLPLDVWAARIPFGETRQYVSRVMTNWIRYAFLSGQAPPEFELHLPPGLRAPKDAY
jgi:soluble lytic murein transglycosylase